MSSFPRGSEWRKWDLHVHVPGTRLNNQYAVLEGGPDWDRFCQMIEESDVAVIGVTDYFAATSSVDLIARFRELYPQSSKMLLPNMELRLNEAVNPAGEEVNIHLLFRPDTTRGTAERFMRSLKTEINTPEQRSLGCDELGANEIVSATVTRDSIKTAIEETFGSNAVRQDHILIVTSSKGDGIRPDRGALRKANLTDEIDKLSDGFFGASSSTDYFLETDRLEDKSVHIKPKPVFSGSDARSFEDLEARLGRDIPDVDHRNEVTWVKADPTFEGLQQTLIEPKDRVRLQPTRPDAKEPYQHISTVRFEGTVDFPGSIILNENLVSIIGSRSSGKSALLAYIAHVIDPEYTISQLASANSIKPADTGPAAGKTWAEVQSIRCIVEWGDPAVESGKVIFIPQNSLFAISSRPDDVTAKIRPVLFRHWPDLEAADRKLQSDLEASSVSLRSSVERWFLLSEDIAQERAELRNLGDKVAVVATRDNLAAEVARLREASTLGPSDVEQYQTIQDALRRYESRLREISEETEQLVSHLETSDDGSYAASVGVEVRLTPESSTLPRNLGQVVGRLVTSAQTDLIARVKEEIVSYQLGLNQERGHVASAIEVLKSDNRELIEKNEANSEIETLVRRHRKQEDVLDAIAGKESIIQQLADERDREGSNVEAQLRHRESLFDVHRAMFEVEPRALDGMAFGIEVQVSSDSLDALSKPFNKQELSAYVGRDSQTIKLNKIQQDPKAFLESLLSGEQKINRGEAKERVAVSTLTAAPYVRFYATLEGDRVGGFARSSMTPGKQALFALTLILNESQEAWPLLIDQPEDDLDSRSMYESIVPYLIERKKERQIIMVSRDANLVVGADSEQVLVANRHGDDRKNRAGRLFDYLAGSLENTKAKRDSEYVLEACGIREHACDILDGGEDAFRKRKEKYKI